MLKQGGKILSSSKDSDFSFGKTRRLNPLLVQRNSDLLRKQGGYMAAKQKILIVDDDNNIAELISLYLKRNQTVLPSLPGRQ